VTSVFEKRCPEKKTFLSVKLLSVRVVALERRKQDGGRGLCDNLRVNVTLPSGYGRAAACHPPSAFTQRVETKYKVKKNSQQKNGARVAEGGKNQLSASMTKTR
jgi:hypothetical protein